MPQKTLYGIVRIPKSGSSTLRNLVQNAFPSARLHLLPDCIRDNAQASLFQYFRFWRSRAKSLLPQYRTLSFNRAVRMIEESAADGDIIGGGHIDYAGFARFTSPVKLIVLVRDPVTRLLSEYNYNRSGYLRKPWRVRFDASVKAKLAGRYSLEGYVDAMAEQPRAFGNTAAKYLGIETEAGIETRFSKDVLLAGALEEEDRFRRALEAKAGIPVPPIHTNATRETFEADIPAHLRGKIEKLYALDFAIHDFVLRFPDPG